MIKRIAVINPGKPKASRKLKAKRKKLFKKKRRLVANKQIKKLNGSKNFMAAKKRRVKRHRKNPVTSLTRKRSTGGFHRKVRRHRRNPDTGMMLSGQSLMGAGLGVVGGVLVYKFTNGLLQTEGNGKYLTGAGIAVLGWWLLGKFYKPAALPFAVAVGAIVVNEYLTDSGLLDGVFPNDDYSAQDLRVLSDWSNNYNSINGVPLANGVPLMNGVPNYSRTMNGIATAGDGYSGDGGNKL